MIKNPFYFNLDFCQTLKAAGIFIGCFLFALKHSFLPALNRPRLQRRTDEPGD
jgi:hypothetical protein